MGNELKLNSWVKREEFRFRGDAACSAWRNATVDEIVEHFKNR